MTGLPALRQEFPKRMFDRAAAGRIELLGRREPVVGPLVGEVLPTRWIE